MQWIVSRRALIDSAPKATPFLVALDLGINPALAATLPPVDPSDPTAKALGDFICRALCGWLSL